MFLSNKKIVLLGPHGSGKSTTGNYLAGSNSFTTGSTIGRTTTRAKLTI